MQTYEPTFYDRYSTEIKQSAVIAAMLLFLGLYLIITPLQNALDKPLTLFASKFTKAYSQLSLFVFQKTGHDIGLLTLPPDPDFLLEVQIATAVNERHATPLLDMASDSRLTNADREKALLSLLRFDSPDQWVQPFLNELPKGGLYQLYEDKSPVIDQLFAEIRANGGIRQQLVRDYAEVVFGFLLQSKNAHIKEKTFRWMYDAIPEEAITLIAERIEREKDPVVQSEIENALWKVKAIPNPERVKAVLSPFYRNPPWPGVKLPVATILARLGANSVLAYLQNSPEVNTVSKENKIQIALGISQEPFPNKLPNTSPNTDEVKRARIEARRAQYAYVVKRQRELFEENRLKESFLSQTSMPAVTEEEAVVAQPEPAANETSSPDSAQTVPPVERPVKTAAKPETTVVAQKPAADKQATKPSNATGETAMRETKPAVVAVKTPTKSVPSETPAEPEKTVQVASLPPGVKVAPPPVPPLGPPNTARGKKTELNMTSVDYIFEVKDNFAPIYADAGAEEPTADTLTKGSKGQATFKVNVGDVTWYQIKSKSMKGWVKADALAIYDLSPEGEPAPKKAVAESEPSKRQESTYFQPNSDSVAAHKEPSEKSPTVGTLIDGISYLAIESKKVGPDRWFFLEVSDGVSGWVQGIDLQLADVAQPAEMNNPAGNPLSLKGKKSAFAADFIEATVKGVGVYDKPTIVSQQLGEISPSKHYRVVDHSEGGGNEWYKIELSKKKQGWVQAMDVSLRNTEK